MRRTLGLLSLFSAALLVAAPGFAADGNRLTYLTDSSPYYVGRDFPKLVTPQWVGADGVEAVIVLAIDDMRGPDKWEAYLRPIIRRLQQIDGRAPVSIMTCQIDPKHPHLQTWLEEGISLETHTFDHPCPILRDGNLEKAKATYDRAVDLLSEVPNSKPVAFRTPCCDSLNTPGPRLYAEIFNKTTPKGNFLTMDSSVFNLITADDPELPRELVFDPDGREKFRKYLPADRTFVNVIEDYPYPYVINRLCWQMPCVTPSDWSAQHYHKPNNPITVRDWKAALDATVIKQGVFNLVFHPHGWIKAEQVNELIDHAVTKHGKKVKFLTFREVQERIDRNMLGGQPLRHPKTGGDHGVRLLDVNNDGFMDVLIGNSKLRKTRTWSDVARTWIDTDLPRAINYAEGENGFGDELGVRFGVLRADSHVSMFCGSGGCLGGLWHFDGTEWVHDGAALKERLMIDGKSVDTVGPRHQDLGLRLCDLDRDGRCELIVANPNQKAVFSWSPDKKTWEKLPFAPPAAFVDAKGRDAGLRFVDVNEDGYDDIIFSNEEGYSLHLFTSMEKGWSRPVLAGKHGDRGELPMISRGGTDNGAWFASRSMWVQNESTNLLKDLVDRRSFSELLQTIEPEAKSAEASLACLKPRPGFRVEQMAAEPLTMDPVAFEWGPDGKFWIVEMADYPLGIDGKGKHGGRVRFLEDIDGDGKYDKSTLFLENIGYPTGVMPWGKGVLVSCAPEIFYAEDTNGDGKADVREPLFVGFAEGNQQHRVNGFVWGLDNWVYCANGDSGGRVKSVKSGAVVDIRGRDLRIRPDEGLLDLTSGQTQFGRNRDDWGNWFGGNNTNPMWHFALDDRYLRRNPHVTAPDPRVPVSIASGAATVYPISRTLPRFNSPGAENHFTSACSHMVYRDDLFGPQFVGNTFVSEPVHNLVHREVMTAQGVTFTSRRAADEQRSEFLASSDNWFRPTMVKTGPDGALWVADMYRHVIEHPEWIPKDWQKRLDLRAGHDRGRIYRVYPVGVTPRPIPRLDKLDTAGLVASLDSPSGWQRDTVQQLLVRRRDLSAVPLLEKMTEACQRPLGRLHALCALDGLGALKTTVLRWSLYDTDPRIRRHATRLCEGRFKEDPELGRQVLQLLGTSDAQVRLQAAYTLGEWDDRRAGQALGRCLVREAGDRLLVAAAMSSVNRDNLAAVLVPVVAGRTEDTPAAVVDNLFRMAVTLGDRKALAALLDAVGTPQGNKFAGWQLAAVAGLLDALEQRGQDESELRAMRKQLAGLFDAARAMLTDSTVARTDQLRAVRLLGSDPDRRTDDLATLTGLLAPQTPTELQAAAVDALGRLRGADAAGALLRGWRGYLPGLRTQVLDALLRRPEGAAVVLNAIEQKQLAATEVDAARRQQLLQHRTSAIRERAAKLFTDAVNADRQKVVASYATALTLNGDAARGLEAFKRTCAACHKLGDAGKQVGPDLVAVGDKSPEALLAAILDPNRAVEARYVGYNAVTRSGQSFTGVLASETGTSITLVGADGKEHVLLRKDLDELFSSGKSAMPEGLEKDLKPQDVADLIALVRASGPVEKPKSFAGNKPELIRAGADGSLTLLAANGEIYGSSLVFEPAHRNLGYWGRDDDHVDWQVEVPRTGRYVVWFEWACADDSAGNGFVLRVGASQLAGKVLGTGSWEKYRDAKAGEMDLQAGRQRVVLRSTGSLRGYLMDLRSVRLAPVP